jgi:hypothetical protein
LKDLPELRKRTALRMQGVSKTYSWDDAKKLIIDPQEETTGLSEKDIKWLEEQSEQRRRGLVELSSWQDIKAGIIAKRKAFDK